MTILGLIPARGGSKGIPGKNIKPLRGKPLLQYSIEAAKRSQLLSRIVLSSDDERIMTTAKKLGLEVPFQRPAELAGDSTGSLAVLQHAVQVFANEGEKFEAVCLLQPTSPFRRDGLIDEAIEKFSQGGFDSLISVREVPSDFNPHWVFEAENGSLKIATGEDQIIPRRQDLPKAYHRDGAIYLVRTEVLMNQHSLYGKNIGFIDTTGDPYVNLDTPEDWEEAEKILLLNNDQ